MANIDFSLANTIINKAGRASKTTHGAVEVDFEEFLFYIKQGLIDFSREALREELDKGFPEDYVTVVDNKRNKPIESVKPLGKIQFLAPRDVLEIIEETAMAIAKRSPKGVTGIYRKNNFIIYNDKLLQADSLDAVLDYFKKVDFKKGDKIRFVNITPYASMLEREGVRQGKSGIEVGKKTRKSRDKKQRSGPVVRAPNGAYHLSWRAIKTKFGNLQDIRFEWINGRYLGNAPFPRRAPRQRLRTDFAPGSKFKGAYVYPSILIRVGTL